MCIQSYYNNENEIELDLLSEIKKFGIAEWSNRVNDLRSAPQNAGTPDSFLVHDGDGIVYNDEQVSV